MDDDLSTLMGHNNIIFAPRKGRTIRSSVLNNRALCIPDIELTNQKCMGGGCLTCPQMLTVSEIEINGIILKLPTNVCCKSKNVIYIHICKICNSENCYGGQTCNKFSDRNSGHRSNFDFVNFEKSALSHHSYLDHGLNASLKDFNCAIIKKCGHLSLDREEFKLVERLRLNTLGLNRCKIVR